MVKIKNPDKRGAGGQTGTCVLPDKKAVDALLFLQGMIAQEYSYCYLNNYSVHIVMDANLCALISSSICDLCVFLDWKEKEVTALMSLDFKELNLVVDTSSCGGSTCSVEPPTAATQAKNALPVSVAPILCAIGSTAGIAALMRRK